MDPFTIILVSVIAVLCGIGGVIVVLRRRPKKEEPVFHFNCPKCRRRLRYRAGQIGHAGQCPQCKSALTFPAVPGMSGKSAAKRTR
jgi:hypothetical protein